MAQARGIRLRLKFAEPQRMLSARQQEEGLEQCWIAVPPRLCSVGDVATFIRQSFDLDASCCGGIGLVMDGFTLPLSQPASLLEDGDTVIVKRLDAQGDGLPVQNVNFTTDVAGYVMDAPALKRFNSLEGVREASPAKMSLQDFLLDVFGIGRTGGQVTVEEFLERLCEQRFLKGKSGSGEEGELHAGGRPVLVGERGEMASGEEFLRKNNVERGTELEGNVGEREEETLLLKQQKKKKGRKKKEEVERSEKKRKKEERMEKKEVDENGKKRKRKDQNGNQIRDENVTVEEGCDQQRRKDEKSVSALPKKKAEKEAGVRQECILPDEGENERKRQKVSEEDYRPSRSARRKKAKRLWLRKQAEAQTQVASDLQNATAVVAVELTKDARGTEQSESSEEEEDDDQRSSVPVIVRPGHIRFEPLDDEDTLRHRHSPEIRLGLTMKTKKQGQVWGQEEDASKNEKKHHAPYQRIVEPQPEEEEALCAGISFELFPTLGGNPEEGDLLAYRIVELSASWTPDLSAYRVGEVTSFDEISKRVVLKPVEKYSLRETFPSLPGEREQYDEQCDGAQLKFEEFVFPCPYNSDGWLEVDFGELVDVHLVQKGGRNNSANISAALFPIANDTKERTVVRSSSKVGVTAATSPEANKSANGGGNIFQFLESEPPRHKSSRTLRAAALGPALALLRAQHEI